jgi:hypothetical protein
MHARVHYRVAGFDIANRRWLRGARHLLIAGAAQPGYVLGRLAAQVHLPWQRPANRAISATLPPSPTLRLPPYAEDEPDGLRPPVGFMAPPGTVPPEGWL